MNAEAARNLDQLDELDAEEMEDTDVTRQVKAIADDLDANSVIERVRRAAQRHRDIRTVRGHKKENQ
jgi:phosphoribosylformylglycinamidine (FGAM) synthase PurS component